MRCVSPLVVLCLLLGLATGVGAQPTAAPADKPALLFVHLMPDATVARKLAEAGYVWGTIPRDQTPTAEFLRKFNVVVLMEFPQVGTQGPTVEQIKYMDTLRDFVAQGGGLFIWGGNDQDTGMCVRFQQELLKPYGGTVLREYVNDPANAFQGRSFKYTWTNQVAQHPLTEGVTSLFYPMMTGWGGTSLANPLQADNTWTVLVRGMPTAYTCALYDSKPMEDKPATYASSPPLVAVKQAGGGRIALWPTLATCTFEDGYHWLWDDGLVLEGKVGEKTSQGLRLTMNLLKWLAEPSVAAGRLAGFVPETKKRDLASTEPGFARYDWDTVQVPDGLKNTYKVLIGARTALSSGTGGVADYATEAKKAGYSYLVITEDLDKMTLQKWDQLVAQCKAAATADFLVDPGFHFTDENGNQGVVWGDIGFPKEEWMSDKVPGRIKAIWHWTHGFHYWPPVAVIMGKANPKRPWFLGKCKGFAAFTYQNGKLVDEDVAGYLELMHLRFDNFPLAVHLMDSPARVAAAAAPGNMQTYVQSNNLAEVPGHMSGTYGEPRLWYWPIFISSGPMITQFGALNQGTTDLAAEENDRYRLRVGATSAAGLQEVRLWDGPRLMRRFAVTGDAYDRSFDFFHDQQRSWVVEVTDQAGGRAISWDRWVEVQEQWLTNCGDNWNFMDGGKWRSTRFTDTRGLEAHIGRAGVYWEYPNITAMEGDKSVSLTPARPAIFMDKTMVSRFASVVDLQVDSAYEPSASANWNDFAKREAITPLTALSYNTRCTFYTSRPDEPEIRMIEGTITFKQPVKFGRTAPVHIATCYSGKRGANVYDHLIRYDAQQGNLCEVRTPQNPKDRSWFGTLAPGGYLQIFPNAGGSTGLFALDQPLSYHAWMQPDTTNFFVYAGEGGYKELPAGSTLGYRHLVVNGRRFTDPSNAEMEWIRTSLGLQGQTAYTVTPSVGQVLSNQYVLRLQADQGGFRAKFTQAHLPEDLPVQVEGLSDRWSAGVWYVGQVPIWRPEWGLNEYEQLVAEMKERKLTDVVYHGPVLEGRGYFGVDLEKSDREVFLGNFLTCDQPEVFLHLLDTRPGKRQFEVHNASDKPVTTTVKPGKGFTLLGTWEKRIDVPARSSAIVRID